MPKKEKKNNQPPFMNVECKNQTLSLNNYPMDGVTTEINEETKQNQAQFI